MARSRRVGEVAAISSISAAGNRGWKISKPRARNCVGLLPARKTAQK
jgi:hypothetical protein